MMSRDEILNLILKEQEAQDEKWGAQNHPDGTGSEFLVTMTDIIREHVDALAQHRETTFAKILMEEVAEAVSEADPEKLCKELVQVAAVCATWIAAIERRK